MTKSSPIQIAIFASGTGTNAHQLLKHFQNSEEAEVALLVSNRASSGIFEYGPDFGVPTHLLPSGTHRDAGYLLSLMSEHSIDLIVLAGYLKLIPPALVSAFPNRIINIHPSLLPLYGGKGMYGARVHEAVLENGDQQSGITIHFVNEIYDQGEVILQEKLLVAPGWDAKQLQQAIHRLEYEHFPKVVEKVCHEIYLAKDKS